MAPRDVKDRSGNGTAAPERLASYLERVLGSCADSTLRHLLEGARLRVVPRDRTIYRQGDPAPLTVILDGYGAARRTTVGGKVLVSGIAPAGSLFGWSGVASVPSSVELVALTDCQVAQWSGADVRSLVAADPEFALAAIDSMSWSLHQTVERIEGFLHQDAQRRVLRVLAQYRELFFDQPVVLGRSHLPGLVGTSREMTGHVLRRLEHQGVLSRVGRDGLVLHQPAALDQLAS